MKPIERESAFDRIDRARKILSLPERSSVKLIREKYHEMSRRWHPDLNPDNTDTARKKQQEINLAYQTLLEYCAGFEYSFRREDIQSFQSGEDFWWEHFGQL